MRIGPHNDPQLGLWMWLSRTRDAIFKARMRELRKYGISARQASVLFVLKALGEKANPTEVARWLLREPHSVSEFMKRMEKDGLVKRKNDVTRRNVIRIKLTAKGEKAFQRVTKLDSIHGITSVLSGDETEELRKLLEKLWYRALRNLRIERHAPFPTME